jgi:DNA-binding LacI/PurR family transcriptional regulator
VPEGAIANLVKEGLVVTRPRHGCVVQPQPGRRTWLGHVLLVHPMDYYSLFQNIQISAANEVLSAAGYLATCVDVKRVDGRLDFSRLEFEASRNVSSAIVFGCNEETIRRLSDREIPHVDFSHGIPRQKKCLGHVEYGSTAAHGDFVKHCVRAGVRHVAVVGKAENAHVVAETLRRRGIRVSLVAVSAALDSDRVENLERETCRAVDGLFAKHGRRWLPDVIYVEDDYQAIGALFSLFSHGVRIPEDVGFVTVKNRSVGPALAKSMTCVEHDPAAVGSAVGKAVVGYLEKGVFDLDSAAISPKYVVGETFVEAKPAAGEPVA